MASVRVVVVHTARRLADAAVAAAPVLDDGCEIPADTLDRLWRVATAAERPVMTLRWAWRSQTARYVDSGSLVDGLAAMYLLAVLLQSDTDAASADVPMRLVR